MWRQTFLEFLSTRGPHPYEGLTVTIEVNMGNTRQQVLTINQKSLETMTPPLPSQMKYSIAISNSLSSRTFQIFSLAPGEIGHVKAPLKCMLGTVARLHPKTGSTANHRLPWWKFEMVVKMFFVSMSWQVCLQIILRQSLIHFTDGNNIQPVLSTLSSFIPC